MGFLVGDWDLGLEAHDEFIIVARIMPVVGSETLQGWKLTQNDMQKQKHPNFQPNIASTAKSCEQTLEGN